MSRSGRKTSWMSGSGQEAFPDVRELSEGPPEIRELSGDTPRCPEVVGGPPGCPGVFGRTSPMSRRPS